MKRLLLIFWVLLLLQSPAWGAVAYDNADKIGGTAVSSLTISNFAVAATNPYIIASVGEHAQSLTGVTFNSVSLDQAEQLQSTYQLTVLGKTGQSGTHDVVASFGGSIIARMGVISFTGVDQVTPIGTVQTSLDYISTPISLTVPANGMGFNAVMDTAGDLGTGCVTYTATNQDKRFEDCAAGEFVALGGATIDTTTADLFWDPYMGGTLFQVGMPINPATASAANFGILRRRQ